MLRTIVRVSPSVEDLEMAAYAVFSALDNLLSVAATLQPDPTKWDAPIGALNAAMRECPECKRLNRRLRDGFEAVRAVVADDEEALIDDVKSDAEDLASAAAAVGFALGVSCARSAASGRAVA